MSGKPQNIHRIFMFFIGGFWYTEKSENGQTGAAGVKGERLMPAMITHYLFAQRVMAKCRQAGIPIADRDAALIGAQGPDIFFFHRVMPWQRGVSYARQGSLLHKRSPARLFEAFRAVLNRETAQREQMLGYVEGFFCHYALDRSIHPFVYYWQEQLHQEDPGTAKTAMLTISASKARWIPSLCAGKPVG